MKSDVTAEYYAAKHMLYVERKYKAIIKPSAVTCLQYTTKYKDGGRP